MTGITLEQAQAQLDAYLQAEQDILLNGQATAIHGRDFRHATLADIQAGIQRWEAMVKRLSSSSAGRMRIRGITPVG